MLKYNVANPFDPTHLSHSSLLLPPLLLVLTLPRFLPTPNEIFSLSAKPFPPPSLSLHSVLNIHGHLVNLERKHDRQLSIRGKRKTEREGRTHLSRVVLFQVS